MEVADSVIDRSGKAKNKHKDRHFSKDELKEIFSLKTDIQKCETMNILKQSMKEWKVCSNSELIKMVIPINDTQKNLIPVIFQRSVDPKTDNEQSYTFDDDDYELQLNDIDFKFD